ncbi:MAG: hypothetical protein H6625_11455 [Bdellovibrionaceae bacterium]|nr:hypothetical protein [Pseudobdellovibrionaceae bacterium]
MNKSELREIIDKEIFSYQSLCVALSDYRAPLQKINELLKKKIIIRVKKGLYVFAPDKIAAYNPYTLANLIYGPSYISFESALSLWGIIPERVEEMQSVTSKRNKKFNTPLGQFHYRYLNISKYTQGIILLNQKNGEKFLIATAEKAMIDYMTLTLDSEKSKFSFTDVINDLRIDEQRLCELVKIQRLRKILKFYSHPLCQDFLIYIEKQEENNG